ncbi:MAG: LemA family protein [Gemmatimonadetes bacterium]|nr:LemA family protein [Gemmatimonadota bacterium]
MGFGLLIIALAVILGVVFLYNALTKLTLLADNAWSDIDVQLKRRHELVPNLVAAVQGHAGYERTTLEAVVSARNRAMAAHGPGEAGAAEGLLAGAVGQLLALAEAYPDLRAAASFLELQRGLVEIEDQVQQARRYYNAVVRDLNTKIAQFPANLVAKTMGFRPREFFDLDDPNQRAAPEVRL